MEINDLIQACKKNQRIAQSQLYQLYKEKLYMVSLKYCRNVEEAEDLLHDAFLTIFSSIKSYKNRGSFEGWMKRIVINKAIDRYRKKTYHSEINDDMIEDTTILEEEMTIPLSAITNFVQELPDQYRLVFSLYQLDGYSHKEVATMLSISESTSKSNFHRAKVILKRKILGLQNSPHLKVIGI